jgi:hypothetical protein
VAGERSVKIKFIAEKVAKFVTDTAAAGGALERWGKQADAAGAKAAKFSAATGALIKPGAIPALAAFGAAAVGTAAALGAGTAALGVFGAVAASAQKEITESADKFQDLGDKIELYGRQAQIQEARGEDNTKMLKKQAAAMLELDARLSLLPPNQRKATQQFIKMRASWRDFVDANKPQTYGLLERGYRLIGDAVGKLQPLYDVGAAAAGKALAALERFAAGGGVERLVNFLATNAAPALEQLGRIGSNVFSFLGSLFKQTADDGQGFLVVLGDATEKLARFGDGGGLAALLDNLTGNAPAAGAALSQIGSAAVVIAQALGPLAPISIAIASALAGIIAALPPGVITALVGAWLAYTAAMTAYNAIAPITVAVTKLLAAEKTKSAIATARATVAERASAAATVAGNAARGIAAGVTAAWTAATNLLSLSNIRAAATTVATTAAAVAASVAQRAVAISLGIWTAAQWLLNAALNANPIGLIIAGIVALIAIIVLIATKTTWFQDIWRVVWAAIQAAAGAVSEWFTNTLLPSLRRAFDQLAAVVRFVGNVFSTIWRGMQAAVQVAKDLISSHIRQVIAVIGTIRAGAESVLTFVRGRFDAFIGFIRGLPGRIAAASSGLFDGLKSAFRSAINFIIDKWNALSFSLPSVNTPFGTIGGTTLSTPNLPRLATGGWAQPGRTYLTGEQGPELLSVGRRAYVSNAADTSAMLGGGTPEIHVYIGDRELTDMVDIRIETSDRGKRRRAGARV